jgi:nucleoside-diphosphate-sugar epimerase
VRGLVLPHDTGPLQGVDTVSGALSDPAALRALVAGADAVVHLAALGVQGRDRDVGRMGHVNILEPLALLDAAAAVGIRHFVAAGTCLEYAGHGRLPEAPSPREEALDESSSTECQDLYGATKAAGGLLLRARARTLDIPVLYARFASMYGPGDDPAKLLPGAVKASVARVPFSTSGGEQVREWLHVDDAVRALLVAIDVHLDRALVVNVGTGRGVPARQVVALAFQEAGADPSLIRSGERPYRPGEVHRLVMECSRARSVLRGWLPTVELEEGIAALVRTERASAVQ